MASRIVMRAAYATGLMLLTSGIAHAQDSSPKSAPIPSLKDCDGCPEMVVVPAGQFTMGSPSAENGRSDDESPQHEVTIPEAFAVGKFEVTFGEWDACVESGGCSHTPDDHGWGRGRQPVINVSWDDAMIYVEWLSKTTGKAYRLLSESEWEFAARAGTATPFATGATITTDQANFDGRFVYGEGQKGIARKQTVPVGSFAANDFGLHDMHGNVVEWVQDCWQDSYNAAPQNGLAWTSGNCVERLMRGGSWNATAKSVRSADRDAYGTGQRNIRVGFRVGRKL